MSPKYRQQGYQDSEPAPERQDAPRTSAARNLTTEERIQLRSLRRATAREASEVVRCHDCGTNVENTGSIGKETCCPRCSTALHCCRACVQFDPSARWQCRAPIPSLITAKAEANDCASYQPRLVLDATGRRSPPASSGSRSSSDPRSQFENLFKR